MNDYQDYDRRDEIDPRERTYTGNYAGQYTGQLTGQLPRIQQQAQPRTDLDYNPLDYYKGEGPEPRRQQRPQQQRRRPGGPPRQQRRRGPQPPRRGGGGGFDGQSVGLIFQRGLADLVELIRNFFSAKPERAFRTILSFPAWITLLLLNLLLFGVKQVLDAKAYLKNIEVAGLAADFKGWSTFGIGLFTQAIHLVVLFALIYAFAQLLQSEYRPPVVFVNLLAQASFPYILMLILWIPLSLLLPGFMIHLSMLPMIFFYLTLYTGFKELDNTKRTSPYWLFLVLVLVSQLVLSYLPTVF